MRNMRNIGTITPVLSMYVNLLLGVCNGDVHIGAQRCSSACAPLPACWVRYWVRERGVHRGIPGKREGVHTRRGGYHHGREGGGGHIQGGTTHHGREALFPTGLSLSPKEEDLSSQQDSLLSPKEEGLSPSMIPSQPWEGGRHSSPRYQPLTHREGGTLRLLSSPQDSFSSKEEWRPLFASGLLSPKEGWRSLFASGLPLS